MLDRNACVIAVFLDLKKAIDTVNHEMSLSKLTHFNFSVEAISRIRSYLDVWVLTLLSPLLWMSLLVYLMVQSLLHCYYPCILRIYLMYVAMLIFKCIIFTSANSIQQASSILISEMVLVNNWLFKSCLSLNLHLVIWHLLNTKKRKQQFVWCSQNSQWT